MPIRHSPIFSALTTHVTFLAMTPFEWFARPFFDALLPTLSTPRRVSSKLALMGMLMGIILLAAPPLRCEKFNWSRYPITFYCWKKPMRKPIGLIYSRRHSFTILIPPMAMDMTMDMTTRMAMGDIMDMEQIHPPPRQDQQQSHHRRRTLWYHPQPVKSHGIVSSTSHIPKPYPNYP